ncbi:L,D-transpeptidase family protein [Mesorhizobium xinjiangense]|uniref:L,D-transpeptidase family protein n=1 Tax=Mesorhizobium xinjiangense TaxID=2678685 RepID=UPI0012ED1F66|nr:murein L,D-transpeptidase family protein [Mesorhizobium xinjiangense]
MFLRLVQASFLAAAVGVAAVGLSGCTDTTLGSVQKAEKQLPREILDRMRAKGMARNAPIMARIFKEEGKLEIWKKKRSGRYDIIASYDICKWSGQLGPKFVEGDRQAPEGFYTVRPTQMNPQSSYHLAFNIGYPNAFDQAHGRTGSHLMVHGACSSSGCYSMTDEQIEQIYAFGRDAFRGGQKEFQVQAFPFRMTAQNMARYRGDPNYKFWTMLKEGYDHFEITRMPPKVDVCEKRYVFNSVAQGSTGFNPAGACPPAAQPETLVSAYQAHQSTYQAAFSAAAGNGVGPAPKPSIAGLEEARLVAEWSRKRARGERVTVEPPSVEPDGTVVATSRMGRIDSPAGRKQAAIDARAAEKKRKIDEATQLAAQKAAEEKAAAIAAASAAATQSETVVGAPPASAENGGTGLLGRVSSRLTGLFGR